MFKRKVKQSDWMRGLLEAEQHHKVDGHSLELLGNVAKSKYESWMFISEEAYNGVCDYIWFQNYLENNL